MNLILTITDAVTGDSFVSHRMEYTDKGKLIFMPSGKDIKKLIKEKLKEQAAKEAK